MKLDFWSNEAIKSYLLYYVEQEPGGCWLWKLGTDPRGYAVCQVSGRRRRAARLAYEIWVGPIPEGFDIHHTCQHRACICPDHLEALPHGRHMGLHSQSGVWAGEKNGRAKLSERDVQVIRVLGNLVKPQTWADQYGVSLRSIYNVLAGRTWRYVELPNFPKRSLEEVLEQGRARIQKAHSTFLRIRADCQKRGIPEPPSLDRSILLSSFWA